MTRVIPTRTLGFVLVLVLGSSAFAAAQSLGTFRWQLSPYCNVVTFAVTQVGLQYRFEGYDDQCGAVTRAPATGWGVANADGTLELGFTIITAAGPSHLDVTFSIAPLGGPWRDSSGATGTFVFFPAGTGTGPPRPAPAPFADGSITTARIAAGAVDSSKVLDGSIGAADINTTQVQRRVSGVCAAGQFVQSVNADGTVACDSDTNSGGTISGVTAGTGLTGGGTSGTVSLAVNPTEVQRRVTGACGAGQFVQSVNADGTVVCATDANSGGTITGVTAGTGLSGGGGSGGVSLAVNLAGSGAQATVARSDHTHSAATNTTVGTSALAGVTTGIENVAVGVEALQSGQYVISSTALGYQALRTVQGHPMFASVGSNNTAVGWKALTANTDGNENVAVGIGALMANTTGSNNTALGRFVMDSTTTGYFNVAIGDDAMSNNVSGYNNVAVGHQAGYFLTGFNNIAIGGNTGGVAGQNGQIRIGAPTYQTSAFIAGITGVVVAGDPVHVTAAGQLGVPPSSARFKEDIQPLGDVSAQVQALKPVSFVYKPEVGGGTRATQYGLIAEQVDQVLPDLVVRNAEGQIQSVRYQFLPPLLLAEVQRLERERASLAAQVAALTARVDALTRPTAAGRDK